MSFHAANPAGFPHLSLCLVERANKSLSTRNDGGELRPSCGGHASSNRTAIAVDFRSQCADENFALERVCRYVSRLCSVTASGLFLRPAALGLLLRLRRPSGLGFPPNQVRKERRKHFSGPSQKADLRHLGAGPTR